jgi:hypothetical protein
MNYYRYPLPIESAIADYRQRFGELPTHWVINKKILPVAALSAQSLNLEPDIQTSGGCLTGEIWLNAPTNGNGNEPSHQNTQD